MSHTQTSYISCLPDELLANVFQVAKEAHKGKGHIEIWMSHVSRRWRDVALHTSSLWTNILINSSTITMAEVYIVRSGSQGLDLRVDCTVKITAASYPSDYLSNFHNHTFPFNGPAGPFVDLSVGNLIGPNSVMHRSADSQQGAVVKNRIVAAALSCIDRWRRITINAGQDVFSKFTNAYAPSLEHLGMEVDSPPRDSLLPLLLLQGGTPALSSLEFIDVSPTKLNIPVFYDKLSSLVLNVMGNGYGEFSDILRGLPSLSHLAIRKPFIQAEGDHMRVIFMPNLRFLTLTGSGYTTDDVIAVLKSISTPKLEEFYVDVEFDEQCKYMNLEHRTVLDQQVGNFCTSLCSLSVNLPIGDPHTLVWFIETLPKDVTTITLHHDSMLLRALIINVIPYSENFEWPPLCLISEEKYDPIWSQSEGISYPVIFSERDMTSLARKINLRFDSQVLWPTLQTLVLRGPHSSFYMLLQLLQARTKAGAPISMLRFQCRGDELSTDFQNTVQDALGKHVDAIEFEYTN